MTQIISINSPRPQDCIAVPRGLTDHPDRQQLTDAYILFAIWSQTTGENPIMVPIIPPLISRFNPATAEHFVKCIDDLDALDLVAVITRYTPEQTKEGFPAVHMIVQIFDGVRHANNQGFVLVKYRDSGSKLIVSG